MHYFHTGLPRFACNDKGMRLPRFACNDTVKKCHCEQSEAIS